MNLFNFFKKNRKSKLKSDYHLDLTDDRYNSLARGDNPQEISDHLEEFRSRLLIVLTFMILTIGGFFYFSEQVFHILVSPFIKYSNGQQLHNFALPGGFILKLKSSFILSLLATLPLAIYQLWQYIKPAVEMKNRLFIKVLLFFSYILFIGGASFTFIFIFPFAVKMLLSFTPADVENTIGANKYLSFLMMFCFSMGMIFNLPVVMTILTRTGIVTPALLINKRKYAIVLIWIIAAILTPPDIITQSLVAIPLMFLYEISIVISKIILMRKAKKERN